jgi:hypothetical protein
MNIDRDIMDGFEYPIKHDHRYIVSVRVGAHIETKASDLFVESDFFNDDYGLFVDNIRIRF